MKGLDQRDRELLEAMQAGLPLALTPFAIVGQTVDMSEKDVLKRIDKLRGQELIRDISAKFDARRLGYRTTLVAAEVAPERIDEAAVAVNQHPGVYQNYARNHRLNLWFTLAVSPRSGIGLDRTIAILAQRAGAERTVRLQALRKLTADGSEDEGRVGPNPDLDPREVAVIRLLQRDVPVHPRPWEVLARDAEMSDEELLDVAKSLHQRGYLRMIAPRVAARARFSASALVGWVVPEERIDAIGRTFVTHRGVGQCSVREIHADWPYNVYTSVHGRTVGECEAFVDELASMTGVSERVMLFPTREYRQVSLALFTDGEREWEQTHASDGADSAVS